MPPCLLLRSKGRHSVVCHLHSWERFFHVFICCEIVAAQSLQSSSDWSNKLTLYKLGTANVENHMAKKAFEISNLENRCTFDLCLLEDQNPQHSWNFSENLFNGSCLMSYCYIEIEEKLCYIIVCKKGIHSMHRKSYHPVGLWRARNNLCLLEYTWHVVWLLSLVEESLDWNLAVPPRNHTCIVFRENLWKNAHIQK